MTRPIEYHNFKFQAKENNKVCLVEEMPGNQYLEIASSFCGLLKKSEK